MWDRASYAVQNKIQLSVFKIRNIHNVFRIKSLLPTSTKGILKGLGISLNITEWFQVSICKLTTFKKLFVALQMWSVVIPVGILNKQIFLLDMAEFTRHMLLSQDSLQILRSASFSFYLFFPLTVAYKGPNKASHLGYRNLSNNMKITYKSPKTRMQSHTLHMHQPY